MTKQQKRFYIVGGLLLFFSTFSSAGLTILEWWLKNKKIIGKGVELVQETPFKFEGYEFTLPIVIGAMGLLMLSQEFLAWVIDQWKTWRYESRDKKQKRQKK